MKRTPILTSLFSLSFVCVMVSAQARPANRQQNQSNGQSGVTPDLSKDRPLASTQARKDIPTIARSAKGSVVSIVMSDKSGKPLGQGSGFVVSTDGIIVTNYHVVAEGVSAVVKFPEGAFYLIDGVVASDKKRDVAVLKAQGRNFRPLKLGNSDRVQVGEDVVAIGNPLSLESTVSNGIVSGVRSIKEEGGKYLQITAPISPGSSGGPLFNMAGEVIGITTMYLKGGENLNFAIPVNDARLLLRSASSKPQDFPNEHESVETERSEHEEHSTPTESAAYEWPYPVGIGSVARTLYDQDEKAGLFLNPQEFVTLPDGSKVPFAIRTANADYVCFSRDSSSAEFFTFQAWAYDKEYDEAQQRLDKHPASNDEFYMQIRIQRVIQESTPYVSFISGKYANHLPPGGRLLKKDVYSSGVKTESFEYHWDGTSWFLRPNIQFLVKWGAVPPRNADAPVSTPRARYLSLQLYKKDLVMEVLRYVESDADHHAIASGYCEKMKFITNRKSVV